MTTLRHRIRDGDPDAFADLYAQAAPRIYNYAYRLLGDWATAEDVVSLTFLEAWRGRHKVNADGGPLLPWLLGIATNVARTTARARRRHAAVMERLPEPDPVPDIADAIVGRADDLDRLSAIEEALRALRRPEREVIALCVYAELDYAAAAEALGVAVGTVRSRLARARARLRAGTGERPTRTGKHSSPAVNSASPVEEQPARAGPADPPPLAPTHSRRNR